MSEVLAIECTAFWCMPHKPNKFGKITMDAGRLNEETVKVLKSLGVKVNFDTDNDQNDPEFKGFYIKPKSDDPVAVTDSEGGELPPTLLIGNGSKMVVTIGVKPWVHKATQRSGVKLQWLGGKVKELVKFDPDANLRAKSDALLDQVSGGGFVFGGEVTTSGDTTDETTADTSQYEELFGDSDEQ